jgi:hypothetical protein
MTVLDYRETLEDVLPTEIVGDHTPLLSSMIQSGFFRNKGDKGDVRGTNVRAEIA